MRRRRVSNKASSFILMSSSKDLESCAERGASSNLGAESYDLRCDSRVVDGVDVLIHEFFKATVGVQYVEVVVPY